MTVRQLRSTVVVSTRREVRRDDVKAGNAMRPFRALASQSPAIVISIAAMILSLGGGAYAATALTGRQAEPASANTFTFHNLTLINGWKAYGLGAGRPGYAVS